MTRMGTGPVIRSASDWLCSAVIGAESKRAHAAARFMAHIGADVSICHEV